LTDGNGSQRRPRGAAAGAAHAATKGSPDFPPTRGADARPPRETASWRRLPRPADVLMHWETAESAGIAAGRCNSLRSVVLQFWDFPSSAACSIAVGSADPFCLDGSAVAQQHCFLWSSSRLRHGFFPVHLLYSSSAPAVDSPYGRFTLHGHSSSLAAMYGSARANAHAHATAHAHAHAHAHATAHAHARSVAAAAVFHGLQLSSLAAIHVRRQWRIRSARTRHHFRRRPRVLAGPTPRRRTLRRPVLRAILPAAASPSSIASSPAALTSSHGA
jgi:hypothetical protein